MIFLKIREEPGILQSEIGPELGLTGRMVGYNVIILEEAGYVERMKARFKTRVFPMRDRISEEE